MIRSPMSLLLSVSLVSHRDWLSVFSSLLVKTQRSCFAAIGLSARNRVIFSFVVSHRLLTPHLRTTSQATCCKNARTHMLASPHDSAQRLYTCRQPLIRIQTIKSRINLVFTFRVITKGFDPLISNTTGISICASTGKEWSLPRPSGNGGRRVPNSLPHPFIVMLKTASLQYGVSARHLIMISAPNKIYIHRRLCGCIVAHIQ